jgi:RimK family alpha-L-glutamate ligase
MSHLKGWLLYTKEDYERNFVFAQRFLNRPEIYVELIFRDDILYGVRDSTLCLLDREGKDLQIPDFVINRTMDSLLSRQLESLGVRVFNSGRISEICNDKARTYLEVSKLGLPMADTLFTDKKTLVCGEIPFSFPLVIKTVNGRGGKEVFLADTRDEMLKIAGSIPKDRFVLQKLSGSPGRDVRVFVVGKEIVGAVLRLSKGGNFKANFSLGGTAEPYTLNEKEREMVMRIADHFDFGMAGIDFIFDEKSGFLFNEIEDVAGSRTLSMTSGTDIVRLYLDHIINILNTSQNI